MTTSSRPVRPDWDTYFTIQAIGASTRATCPRASVGAVIITPDNRIIATGYNGAPPGEPHCIDAGCLTIEGRHCQRALHAELNAIASAATIGYSVRGCRLYLWSGRKFEPCSECTKILLATQVTFIPTVHLYPTAALHLGEVLARGNSWLEA